MRSGRSLGYGLEPAGNAGRDESDEARDNGHERGTYHAVPANFESAITSELLTRLEYQGLANDTFSKMKKRYVEMGGGRSNTRYGWIHRKA